MKTFFTSLILIVVIIAGYFLLHDTAPIETETPVAETPQPAGEPTFAWEYAPFDKGEFPYVTMSLARL